MEFLIYYLAAVSLSEKRGKYTGMKWDKLSKKIPIYECSNYYNEFSEQKYPVNISGVKWVNFISDKYPYGCIQISCMDAQDNAHYATKLLKCHVSNKGRYAIWGKHRFYEGYSGALRLRGVPCELLECIRDAAKPYGTVVE